MLNLRVISTNDNISEELESALKAEDISYFSDSDSTGSSLELDGVLLELTNIDHDIITKARGEADKIDQQSEAYKKEVVARSEGDANRFNSILNSYKKNEDVTKNRIYLETLEEILQNASKL